ncbi:hypothetical protein C2857_007917 [Epichloe festucae Fl1]|uniref:FAD-binding domain-containing protein n=1 Tax=Epichloe festucae (strain Fl1) TaxID=877507 RepID=A0A7S9KMX3_EPIFF|nr:hypothetical protein C2857_007917 [Epichloe festucae Fl1]
MATKKDHVFAIIGGGIAGLTLAVALHHRGLRIKIFEQAGQMQEIGAGVAFTPNALQAMRVCHPAIYEAYERVRTRNLWPCKQKVWFDFYDTRNEDGDAAAKPAFTISNDVGQNGVLRAHFLDELIKLVPREAAHVGKRLESYEEGGPDGRLRLRFADGSEDEADVILACDGIKSRVRQLLFGAHHPCALPSYTHRYAYRALVPMEEAVDAIGKEKAQNAAMHMGKGGHVLTFPVNHGQTVNVVAFHATSEEWPDSSKLTAQSTREAALRDFSNFGPGITKLLKLTSPKLDIWAIFDLGENPPPTFAMDRVCLVGDAAHATSPHHGAGAGFCIEDAAVLAHLLASEEISDHRGHRVALAVYDAVRRERGSWLVQSSRRIGDTYEWMAEGIEDDLAKAEEEIKYRNGVIADVDVEAMCHQAREEFSKRWRAVG